MFKKNEIGAKQLYLKLDESNTYFLSSHIVSKTPYFVFIFLATLLLELFLDYPDARNAALIYLVVLILKEIDSILPPSECPDLFTAEDSSRDNSSDLTAAKERLFKVIDLT